MMRLNPPSRVLSSGKSSEIRAPSVHQASSKHVERGLSIQTANTSILCRPPSRILHLRRLEASCVTADADLSSPLPASKAEASGREDRVIGSMMGALCGNVLGAPVHQDRHWMVCRRFPDGLTEYFKYDFGNRPMAYGRYSGEYCTLISAAQSLVQAGTCDAVHQADTMAGMWIDIRRNDYPDETAKEVRKDDASASLAPYIAGRPFGMYDVIVMDALCSTGAPITAISELATHFLRTATPRDSNTASDRFEKEPYGPADNSAASRITPIALAYRDASPSLLEEAVEEACCFSHSHPLGLDGAQVMAAAVVWLVKNDQSKSSPDELLQHLESVAKTDDMKEKLALIRSNLFQVGDIESSGGYRKFFKSESWSLISTLLSRMTYHGYATAGTEAVAVALLAFVTSWSQPRQAVSISACLAGSAPVTSQMCGE
eukprot:gene19103-25708_t